MPPGSPFASLACSLLAVGLDGEGAPEPAWVWQTRCPVGTQLCWTGGRLSLSNLSESGTEPCPALGHFLLLELLGCKKTQTQVFQALQDCQFSANSLNPAQGAEC